MRLEIEVLHEFACADSRAVHHEIEFPIDAFGLFELHICGDRSASGDKTIGEIVEINRCVHQRNAQRETTLK